jgi:pyruvate/2-oxoglutarate dehydrogenase complex dihydrolipoamide acyltransferase (E2) component
MRTAVLAATIVTGVWLLSLPTELRIEATGTLQPVEQRIVFAPLDGVISRIAVADGQAVEQGAVLAELSSPMLDIELEEVAGELRANAEKLSGLKVAINQLSPEDPSAIAMQNRFSSEIREIETRLLALDEKQIALRGEKEKLTVLAPISGTVIARQVERYLDRRPVRRGDPLLRVVRLDGPWRLELEVADRDAGRVKRVLFPPQDSPQQTPEPEQPKPEQPKPEKSREPDRSSQPALAASGEVTDTSTDVLDFVYAATPEQRWQAEVTWISESARNPRGDMAIVDVHARVDAETAAAGHMGATVQAYFSCGKQPIWFVWSRPLIEAIQRKLWF